MNHQPSSVDRKSRGALAEEAAARFLESTGYTILARNYELRVGEVDIIAERGTAIAFIEVKSRQSTAIALPRENVNKKKQSKIARAAVGYVSINNVRNKDLRFDIIEVYLDHNGEPKKIEHLEHAFELPKGTFV